MEIIVRIYLGFLLDSLTYDTLFKGTAVYLYDISSK